MNSLGEQIKELRQSLGMTQTDLAKAIGSGQVYISAIETGRIKLPDRDRLKAIARAVGASPNTLLEGAGYMEPLEPDALPEPEVYFRLKFGLNPKATRDVREFIEYLKFRETELRKAE